MLNQLLGWPTPSGGGGNLTGAGTAPEIAIWQGPHQLTGDVNLNWSSSLAQLQIGPSSSAVTAVQAGGGQITTVKSGGNGGWNYIAIGGTPILNFYQAEGTAGSEAATSTNDVLMQLSGRGYDTAFTNSATQIKAIADEAFTGSAHGAHLSFLVTQATTTSLTEAVKLEYNKETVDGQIIIVPIAVAGGAPAVTVTGAAHTAGVAEIIDINANLARTVTFTHASVPATQRAVVFQAPTYSNSTLTDTITTAVTVDITGAPAAAGGVTITNAYALRVEAGFSQFNSSVFITNSLMVGNASNQDSVHGSVSVSQVATAGGGPVLWAIAGAHTAVAVEQVDVNLNLARTVTFTHASVPATNRAVYIQAPTYATSSGTDTITTAATLTISGAPTAGSGITITNNYALWVVAGTTTLAGGLNVGTGTGAGTGSIVMSGGLNIGLSSGAAAGAISSTTNAAVEHQLTAYVASATPMRLDFFSARGTQASPAASSAGDQLFGIRGEGYHTAGTPGFGGHNAVIRYIADEAWTDVANGTRFEIYTIADGAVTLTQAMTIGPGAGTEFFGSITLDGQAQRNINMLRETTAATAGNYLAVQSGGAFSGGTDLAAGDLYLQTGVGTGLGRELVRIQGGYRATATGTADQTLVDKAVFNATRSLTNNSATSVLSCTLATGSMIGLTIVYTITVRDATHFQSHSGIVTFVAVADLTPTVTSTNSGDSVTSASLSTGTLAVTWTITAAQPAVIQVNANSSLTPSTGYPRIDYVVFNNTGQAIAVQ